MNKTGAAGGKVGLRRSSRWQDKQDRISWWQDERRSSLCRIYGRRSSWWQDGQDKEQLVAR
jgi:hypothetical protein